MSFAEIIGLIAGIITAILFTIGLTILVYLALELISLFKKK